MLNSEEYEELQKEFGRSSSREEGEGDLEQAQQDSIREAKKELFEVEQKILDAEQKLAELEQKISEVEIIDAEINGGDDSEELKKQNKELEDRIYRNMAEFDNFRKRTAKEKTSMYDDAIKDTVSKLLPVIDSFERAVSTLDPEDDANKGILMIHKQFEIALTSIGVETIKCIGETFDHNLHFAVSHDSDDSLGEEEIVEEMQKGYRYKDKVIRCSMVKVVN